MVVENRNEKRFPCVCLSMVFSPVTGRNMPELAESYLYASGHDMSISGMSFDVNKPIPMDSELVVAVPNDSNSNDKLKAVVRWCKQLSDGHYRIGVQFDIDAGVNKSSALTDCDPVLEGPGVPVEATLVCPACLTLTTFVYKGMQPCLEQENELPLYNCAACNTTRSIPNLLSFNRKLGESGNT